MKYIVTKNQLDILNESIKDKLKSKVNSIQKQKEEYINQILKKEIIDITYQDYNILGKEKKDIINKFTDYLKEKYKLELTKKVIIFTDEPNVIDFRIFFEKNIGKHEVHFYFHNLSGSDFWLFRIDVDNHNHIDFSSTIQSSKFPFKTIEDLIKLQIEKLEKKQNIKENINQNKHLKEIKPNKYVYHTSNPIFRDKISKEGLIPKGKSETWLSDTKIDGEVIFATNNDNTKEWFDSGYDDDIYKIDTNKIKNKWYLDPNFVDDEWVEYKGKYIKLPNNNKEYDHIITFEKIPLDSIELIYKGTGNNKDEIINEYQVSPGETVEWDLENNTTKINRLDGSIEWILQNEHQTLPYLQKFFKTLSKDEIINFGKELYNKVSSGGNKRKIILMGLITAMINYGISKNDIVHEFDSNILNLLEPKNISIENKKEYVGNIDDFLNLLAFKESSGNWKKIRYSKKSGNPVYIGKYQFGKIALQDVGLDPEIINKFKDNPSVFPPELQEKVVKKLIRKNKKYLGKYLDYDGKNIGGVDITTSGLVASSHLRGALAVKKFLDSDGKVDLSDANGTKVSDYMKTFAGFEL
jgi:hypothetical protein